MSELDLEAIKARIILAMASANPIHDAMLAWLPDCVEEIERLRARVSELDGAWKGACDVADRAKARVSELEALYAEQTADARRMSTKLDRISEVMDE